MKFNKKVLLLNGILLAILGTWGIISAGPAGFGLAVFFLALVNIPMALVFTVMKKREALKTCLICMGILFVAGFSICSQASFNMH